jgi:hypothetical protein
MSIPTWPPVNAHRGADQGVTRVFDVVCQFARNPVEPDIADEPVVGRVRTRCQGRVPDDGFRSGMCVMRVFVNDALFQQITEATLAHLVEIAPWQIAAQLIDGDLQYQPGRWRIFGGANSRKQERRSDRNQKIRNQALDVSMVDSHNANMMNAIRKA